MNVDEENLYSDNDKTVPPPSRKRDELQKEGFNKYASHKSVSQNLLNTSVIQSHIGTLVYILSNETDNKGFETAGISLISLSLVIFTSNLNYMKIYGFGQNEIYVKSIS